MTQESTGFDAFGLATPLMKALKDMNFQKPSPIQEQTIPYMLDNRDVIALAQTGTGKTAAFALPILQKIAPHNRNTQALIVAPTRELANQVAAAIEAMSAHMPELITVVLCGGQDYAQQLKKLKAGSQIVVGTPGRILDHIDRGTLKLNNLSTFVLDEADEMLRMGFIEDIEAILARLPEDKQMALFSATMPSRIRQIANNYLKNAASVEIKMETATVKAIEQRFLFASYPQKAEALVRILSVEEHQGVMVFTRTKSSTEEVAEYLQQKGFKAVAIHGDITQNLRERTVAQFRQGTIDIMVATDVAARGLDVERVTHVINFDVPHDCETYVHRIGRTGRAGRSGVTILFVTPREARMVNVIERHTRQRIEKMQIPNDEAIQHAKQQTFMQNIQQRLDHGYLGEYRRIIEDFLKNNEDANPVDVAAALALYMNKDKSWKCDLPAIKAVRMPREDGYSGGGRGDRMEQRSFRDRGGERRGERSDRGERGDRRERDRKFVSRDDSQFSASQDLYRLDVGKIHGVKPGNIVGAIANEAGLDSRFITGLKIHDDHSTVKLPKNMPKEVMQDLVKAWVCGRQLNISVVSA